MADPDRYEFAEFLLDIPRRALLRDGVPLRIGGRALDLLIALVRRRGTLASKRELLAEIWPGVVVEGNNLTTQIASLRRTLGETKDRVFIGTDTGRGYRFVAPLTLLASGAPAVLTGLHPSAGAPPIFAGRLIGREGMLRAVRERIDTRRLVTLVGPGGVGKTRLAVEAMQGRPGAFVFVDAEAGGQAALATLCRSFGLPPRSDPAGAASDVAAALRANPAPPLLILDTVEAALSEMAILAGTLLPSCAGLRILATGREALDVPGEAILPIPRLACPDPGSGDDETDSPALTLLAENAAAILGAPWSPSAQEYGAAASLCRAVDGLPLAIGMAASRLRVSTPAELLARIAEAGWKLAGAPRDAPARQTSLGASLDWSYERLNGEQQTVFRLLAAFPGSFDLDGATAVAAACVGAHADDLLDNITALVGKSLVEADGAGPRMRYRLLNITRQYARAKLEADTHVTACRSLARDWVWNQARSAHDAQALMDEVSFRARFGPELEGISALIGEALQDQLGRAARDLITLAAPLARSMDHDIVLAGWATRASVLLQAAGEPEDGLAELRALATPPRGGV